MNYQKIHDSIIERAKSRGIIKAELDFITEIHHIVPKCMGGLDNKDNIVLLTPKEHYAIHHLLIKIFPKEKGLLFAANILRRLSINESSWARIRMVNTLKSKEVSQETRDKMSKAALGKVLKQSTKDKIGAFQKGRPKSSTMKRAIKEYSLNRSKEHAEKISKANKDPARRKAHSEKIKNLPKTFCEHCNKSYVNYAYVKFHGPKCKKAPVYK